MGSGRYWTYQTSLRLTFRRLVFFFFSPVGLEIFITVEPHTVNPVETKWADECFSKTIVQDLEMIFPQSLLAKDAYFIEY